MKRVLLLFCLLIRFGLKAQTQIGFDPSFVVSFPDSVQQNDTASFIVKVKNYGPAQADSVVLYSGYKNSQGIISGIQAELFIPNGGLTNITPLTTKTGRMVVSFTANRFPLGIDVVVIWPKSLNATTIDTMMFSPLILSPLQVADYLQEEGFCVFPNPFTEQLFIESKNHVATLSIYDLSGNLIYFKTNNENIILSEIAPASYILEIGYKNGNRKRVRVVKQ